MKAKQPFLFYSKTGSGPTPILLFHGYGQDHTIYIRYLERFSTQYTFYNFDLFFHGRSIWTNGEVALEKSYWKEIIETVLNENSIESFSVLGFSMGGKFAMATLESFPGKVKEIILLAPDGVKTSFWYSLATYPIALRNVFKSTINNHERFKRIAASAKRLGLIDKGILRFVETQMDSEEKRKRVYYSWVVFRHLKFDITKIASLINKNNVKLRLYVGRFDKIITEENMMRIVSKVPGAEFKVLEAGHNSIIGAAFDQLK